jgi:hypothetical protein
MANLAITAANVLASATAIRGSGIAGAAITAGQPLYADATDSNKLKPADANVSAATANVVGIALNNAAAGQPVSYVVRDSNFVSGGMMTVGAVYALSATAGSMNPVADQASGDFSTVVMVAKSATVAVLAPIVSGAALP